MSGVRVIGLDLSLTSTGIAGVNSGQPWVERLEPKCLGHNRLEWLLQHIRDYTRGTVDLVVIEGLAFDAHDTNRAGAGLSWLVRHQLWRDGLPFALVTPSQRMKYATGKGRIDKDRVLAAVIRRYPDIDVTGNDEADALILAAMGARHLHHPIDVLPQTHLAAMTAVRWPETVDLGAQYPVEDTGEDVDPWDAA